MLPTAEERIPALANGEEIFSWAAGVALAALDTHQGARKAQGKKPHQGIFSKNRALRVGEILAKWSGTHQDRKCSWSKTVVGSALDANGNTLTDASGKSYTWDFENRLGQAVVPGTNGGTTTFKYDPFGRRIQKSGPLGTTNYLYDGPNSVEEADGAGNVLARYAEDQGVDQPLAQFRSAVASYYQQDGIGSVSALTNSTGLVASSYTYDSFGKLTASSGTLTNPFQYTGREFDQETGIYQYRARYYDPQIGRFISEDALRTPGNLYPYVSNSPLNWVDPTGNTKQIPDDCKELFEYIKTLFSYFEGKSEQYDPEEDGSGLIPRSGGGFHLPGVHYINLVRMQIKIAKALKKWDDNCNGPSPLCNAQRNLVKQ